MRAKAILVFSLILNYAIAQRPTIDRVSGGGNFCDQTQSVSISVQASTTNSLPLSFQWFKDGSLIPSANSNIYNIPLFTSNHAGKYVVRVTNDSGEVSSDPIILNLARKPTITQFDTSTIVQCANSDFYIDINASSNLGGILRYVWQKNSVVIPNALNSDYFIPRLSIADSGAYKVLVTNNCGTVESQVKYLSVKSKPIVLSQPLNTIVCLGNSLQIASSASGADNFQWFKDGSLVGFNSTQLSRNSVSFADSGTYVLEVSNTCGSTFSNPVNVRISQPATIYSVQQSFNGNHLCENQQLILSSNLQENLSPITRFQWRKNGVEINGANAPTYEISRVGLSDNGIYSLDVINGCGLTQSDINNKVVQVEVGFAPQLQLQNNSSLIYDLCEGNSAIIGVNVFANAGGLVQLLWKLNGQTLSGVTTNTRVLSSVSKSDGGRYLIEATNSCGLTPLFFDVAVREKPTITLQPLTRYELCSGQALELRVNASINSASSVAYQWYKDNQIINGANNPLYLVSNLSSIDAGQYFVEVQNSCGAATFSNTTTVVVVSVPTPTLLPISTSVCLRGTARFSIAANTNNGGTIRYQWLYQGTPINGATGPDLILNNVGLNNGGINTYAVQVSNRCGFMSDISPVSLQVNDKPTVNLTSTSTSLCEGAGSVSFTALTDGNPSQIVWKKNNVIINSQNNLSNLSITNVKEADEGEYLIEATNSCGLSISNKINLLVNKKPQILSQPVSQTVCLGNEAIFEIKFNSTRNVRFSWSTTAISAIQVENNSSRLIINSVSSQQLGGYSVEVTNECGSQKSEIAYLSSIPSIPNNVVISANKSIVCSGTGFEIAASSTENLLSSFTYSWLENEEKIYSSGLSVILIPKINEGKKYQLEVTNSCGEIVKSNLLNINVFGKPTFEISPADKILCGGSKLELSARYTSVNSNPLNNPQALWFYNGKLINSSQIINEASTTKYNVNSIQEINAGRYHVAIIDDCGNESISSLANVSVLDRPQIEKHPTDMATCQGGNVSFSAKVKGSNNLIDNIKYQWLLDNNLFVGQEADTLVLSDVNVGQAGFYILRAQNQCGVTFSSPAKLTVQTTPTLVSRSQDFITCANISSQKTIEVVASSATGEIPSVIWTTEGGSIHSINGGRIIVNNTPRDAVYRFQIINSCGSINGSINGYSENSTPVIESLSQAVAGIVCESSNLNLNVKATGVLRPDFLDYKWKRGGGGLVVQSSDYNQRNSPIYFVSNVNLSQSDLYTVEVKSVCSVTPAVQNLNVTVNPSPSVSFDVVSSDNQCLTGNRFSFTNRTQITGSNESVNFIWDLGDGVISQNQNIVDYNYINPGIKTIQLTATTLAGCSNKLNKNIIVQGKPSIIKHPLGDVVCEGSNKSIMVEVESNGATSLSYQWVKDNQLLGGNSNTPIYTLNNMQPAMAGKYKVIIRNNQCSSEIESSEVAVSFNQIPNTSFTINKPRVLCLNNANIEFINNTPDIQGINYLWKVSDGRTASTKNLVHTFNSAGSFSVSLIATVGVCSKEFSWVNESEKIKVSTLPIIKKDLPSIIKSKKGDNASLFLDVESFNAIPSESSNLQFIWYKDEVVYTQINNTSRLTIENITKLDEGTYRVAISNNCGTVNSASSDLVMMDVPQILQQPEEKSICIGSSLQLFVNAISNDDSNPLYEWFYQRTISDIPVTISNATSSNFSSSNFTKNQVGFYYAKISNTVGHTFTRTVFVGDEDLPSVSELISNNDLSGSICKGSELNILVTANSRRNTPINYTWLIDEVALKNQNSSRLIIPSVDQIHAGLLKVVLINSCGSQKQNVGVIDVKSAPVFMSYPLGDSVCIGNNVTLNPTLQISDNSQTTTFQWFKNGLPYLTDQQNLRLEINSVNNSDGGIYSLRATNNCGVTTGRNIPLIILTRPEVSKEPIILTPVCAGTSLNVNAQIKSVDPRLNFRWWRGSQSLPNISSSQLFLQNVNQADSGVYQIEVTNRCGLSDKSPVAYLAVIDKPALKVPILDQVACEGTDISRNLLGDVYYSEITPTEYQWRLNNRFLAGQSNSSIVLQNLSTLQNGRYGVQAKNVCGISEFDVFTLSIIEKPQILTQPVGAIICERNSYEFMVVTKNSNFSSTRFQWYKDNTLIAGVTNPSYRVTNTDMSTHNGVYYVAATNLCGTSNSSIARLTVRPAPKMLINPLSPLIQCLEGNNIRLSAINQSADVLPTNLMWDLGDGTYQNGLNINYSYKFPNDFNVQLISTSEFGCRDTASSLISINDQPLIIDQPKNSIICAGGQAEFSVNVRTRPNESVNYQWFFKDKPLIGAPSSIYTINDVQKNSEGAYKVKVQNSCNSIFSNEVSLQIAEKPIIVSPFDDESVCLDFRYMFKPEVFSLLPMNYTWYKNGIPIPANIRNLDSILFRQFKLDDAAKYKLVVSNRCGVAESYDKNITSKDRPFVIHQPISDTICYNTAYQMRLNTSVVSKDSVDYVWYKDGIKIGQAFNVLKIPSFKQENSGKYFVSLLNQCGQVDIPVGDLTMNRPIANFLADTVDACKGELKVGLLASNSGFFSVKSHRWDINGNKNILQNVASGSLQFNVPGQVLIKYHFTDDKGCNSDTVEKRYINYGPVLPNIFLSDTCISTPNRFVNQSILGFGSTRITRTIWDLGDTIISRGGDTLNLNYTFKAPGLKKVKLTTFSDNSCLPSTASASVMVFGYPTAIIESRDSCLGFPVNFISKGYSPYSPDSIGRQIWTFDDGTTSILKNPTHIFQQYGGHKIKLRVFSDKCPVIFHDTSLLLSIKIPRKDSVYPGIRAVKNVGFNLRALGSGRSYLWSPNLGLSNSRVRTPVLRTQEDKLIYTITIIDSAGCVNNDKQEVWAFPEPNIYLATAFSPNGDKINDTYKPEYIGIKHIEYFKVHDKNNRLVFSTNVIAESWDGKYSGFSLPADAYLVSVSAVDINGNRIQKQQVIVLIK